MRNSIFKLLSKQFISLSFARLSLALLFAAVTMAASFPANAGISQVTGQKFQLPNQGAGTTTSGHFANPPAIGNTILVYVWSWGGSTTTPMPAISVTDNYGNAYSSLPQAVTCNGSPGCEYVAILSAIVVNTGSSFTLTATTANNGPPYTGSSEVGAIALEYTGLAGMDLQNTAVGTVADPTISFPTGQTTNNSNELVAAIVSPLLPAAGYSAIAPSSPWVEEGISTNNCNFAAGEMADQILSTPSNPSITWTPAPVNLGSPCSNGAFTSWVAAIVSLNPDLGCHSIKSGNWSDPTVWSCGVVPPAGGTATIYAGPVTIDGSTNIMTKVTIDSGSTLISGSGGVLNLGGTAGSAAIINSGTLNLGGAGSVVLGNTLSLAGSGSWTFNNLTAGANTINASALASSATVNVTGNLSSRGTFTSGSDTWAFTGSGAQTITGALTFAKLEINNTGSGVTLVSNSNVSVSNALTMTKGVIQTGTNSLIYSPNCVTSPITVSSGSYINGNLNLNFPTGNSTCIFPIGDSTNYAPMTIKTTGNGGTLTGSTVAVPDLTTLTGNPAPTTIIAATDSVNRTWTVGLAATDTLSPNNLNTATFNYCNAVGTGCGVNDVALGASYSYFVALQEVGTTWSQIPTHSVTFNSNNTVVTGLSNFGTFVMGQPTSKVTSINCTSACTTPVFAKTVSWTVTFSQSVTGVQTRDFATVPSAGLPGTSVASVTGSGTTWTVTAYVGTGSGTLGLNLIAAGGTDIPGLMASSPYPPVIFTGQVYTNVSGPAMAVYHMDESAWGSSGTPVSDSSGNGYNAKAMNGATTASTNPLAAIQGNPGTCSYGEMTYSPVSDGYVQTPLPHLATNFTVTAWIYPANVNYVGSRIFVDDNGSQGYGLSIDDGAGHLRFYDRGISSVVLDSNYQLSNNAWYFVAAVADISNGKRYIYVFNSTGTLLNVTQDTTSFTGTWTTGNGTVNIGSSESYFFQGNLDEVQIFNEALTPAAVSSLATQTHVCSTASLDHILIQSSGSGLTCAANTLTLVACQNTDCSTTYSGGVSGTLSYTGAGSVNWDSSTGGGTGANFSIASGSTTITKNMQTTTAGTGIFGLAAEIPLAPNGATCNFGNPLCTFTTSTAGFIFSNTDTGGSNTPAQVSGIASPLYLRAVQASTTNAAVCTPAIINQTASPLMGFVCNNPAACQAGELVTITNATTSAATPIATGSPGTTSVSLNFDANGSAPITVLYYDVGQITLNANMTATPFSGATTVTLNGSSNAFVVKPDHYDLSNVACTTVAASTCAPANSSGNNPAASNAAGAAFIQAGQPFTATITAMNKLNNPTPNYGNESPPQGVSLTPTLVAPATGNISTLANSVIGGVVGAFTNGAATVKTLSWGDVGIITLVATPYDAGSNDYLGAGTVTGTQTGVGNIGRFIPDHFDTAIVQVAGVPMPCPTNPTPLTCPTLYNGFVYSGQQFSLQITAMNSSDVKTQNYDSTLGFSKVVSLYPYSSSGGTTLLTVGALGVTSETVFASGMLTDATEKYTFSTALTTPTNGYICADDTDTHNSITNVCTSSIEGGVTVASGRLNIPNVYGSELLPLTMAVTEQYYSSSGWVTSTTDSLTSLAFPGSYSIGGGTSTVTKNPSTGSLANGLLTLNLSAPGSGHVGSALVVPTSTPLSYLPLWPSSGGTATFGIYGGNNSIIYLHENY